MKELEILSLSVSILICMHDFMKSGHKELNTFECEIGLNRLKVNRQEGSDEMGQASHRNKFETPLGCFLVFLITSLHATNYLKRVEQLVDMIGIENLVPN